MCETCKGIGKVCNLCGKRQDQCGCAWEDDTSAYDPVVCLDCMNEEDTLP